MRGFDPGRRFDLVLIAGNSLLHLHEAADLLSCLRSVRARLAPGALFLAASVCLLEQRPCITVEL